MKEKILEALESGLADYGDIINGDDYVRGYDRGWRRGYREAKELVERLFEREEQAREEPGDTEQSVDSVTTESPVEASVASDMEIIEHDYAMTLQSGRVDNYLSWIDVAHNRELVPFDEFVWASNLAAKLKVATAVIKRNGRIDGYAAVIPFESPKAREG